MAGLLHDALAWQRDHVADGRHCHPPISAPTKRFWQPLVAHHLHDHAFVGAHLNPAIERLTFTIEVG